MRPAALDSATVFSTAGLPDARRVELWEEHNATALIGLAVHAPRPLDASERNLPLSLVHLARVTATAHIVERPAEVIRGNPADAVAMYLSLRGESWFRHDGATRALRPGAVVACDADRPFARGFARGLEELVVKVPRHVLASHAGRPWPAAGPGPVITSAASAAGPARPGDPYARALARMAGRATAAVAPVPADERALLDLVVAVVAGRQVAQATAHRAAAKSYIEDHLTDPRLGAEQVARAIGISTRQLTRVFAADGTSVPRHVLGRRLELAYSLLAAPDAGHPSGGSGGGGGDTIADVGARCGLTSAAHFSHAFAERFGQRASEVRARAGF
ncbi:MAG TPA: helix-turn-helix domain-containing protein [Trebonia sp.]|nr:helix-turn-helix domain-containing protein [Trebonia sp.]